MSSRESLKTHQIISNAHFCNEFKTQFRFLKAQTKINQREERTDETKKN